METKGKILCLDDHSLYLKGLEVILKESFPKFAIDCYTSIEDMMLNVKGSFSDYSLIISDIELPKENIFNFFNFRNKEYPSIPVLVISMHQKLSIIRKCKNLGIEGYILKDDDNLLTTSINTLLDGESYYSPRVERFYKKFSTDVKKISIREEEVLRLICKGFSNQSISNELGISIETVKSHKKNIKSKLGFNETSDLIEYAKQRIIL